MQELGKMLEEVRSGASDPQALALESTITQTMDMRDIDPSGQHVGQVWVSAGKPRTQCAESRPRIAAWTVNSHLEKEAFLKLLQRAVARDGPV